MRFRTLDSAIVITPQPMARLPTDNYPNVAVSETMTSRISSEAGPQRFRWRELLLAPRSGRATKESAASASRVRGNAP